MAQEREPYRVQRSPNDVATVVSLLPYELNEFKPGMTPSEFHVPKMEGDFPGTCIVERGYHKVYLDDSRPRLEVPVPSDELAAAICRDHITSMLAVVPGEAEPGLFWVSGRYEKKDVKRLLAEHWEKVEAAKQRQLLWFQRLIEEADDAWARHGEHKLITDVMRLAAIQCKLERPWISQQEIERALSECPVCYSTVHPKAVVCGVCKAILKPEEHKKLQFAEVK